ncbi:MAG: acyl-CoA thioesterase [Candidatus Omnitrophica bacterium]|nr:acyl-CoA thioesterase [Candidatus Omnitrophota bacterium]
MKTKIYYHHTDCGGVVYYGKYLDFFEEARTEFLRERGIFVKELMEQGVVFVVARQEVDYKLPAFYADTLEIETQLLELSKVKMVFICTAKNQNKQKVCSGKTVMVCVGKDIRPRAIPEEVRKKLTKDR